MPCLNRSFGCSEPVQTAAISRSSRRHCPSTNVLVSVLVASPAGVLPPGILWSSGSNQHHKHFRNCSYHRKHKPLCRPGSLDNPLHPLDDRRQSRLVDELVRDGRNRRLAILWSRRPSIITIPARNSPFSRRRHHPFRVSAATTNLKGWTSFVPRSSRQKTSTSYPVTTQPSSESIIDSKTINISPCDLYPTRDSSKASFVAAVDSNEVLLSHRLSRSSQSCTRDHFDNHDDNNNQNCQINQLLLSPLLTQLLS